MRRLIVLGVLVLGGNVAAQRAVGADKPVEFADAIAKAKSTYDAGQYGACVAALQQALKSAMTKRRGEILAALPSAPDGFEELPQRKPADTGAAGMLGGLAALAGNQITKTFRGEQGAEIKLTVMADSPMGSMAAMMLNPMVIQNDPKSQLFEYDNGHKAVAKVNGDRVSVNALLGGKHLVQLEGRKISQEEAMKVLSQATLDKVAKAIGG